MAVAAASCRDVLLRVLEIAFDTKALRTLCEDTRAAERRYGQEFAKALQRRLADLRATPTLMDLPFAVELPARPDINATCSIRLLGDAFIILRPNHSKTPMDDANAIDWSKIRRVKVMQIQDDS